MIRRCLTGLAVAVLAIIALAPGAVLQAETLPALYSVEGVAADDELNIRAAPEAGAAILGTIAPDTEGVEVIRLSESGAWGQVGTAEGNGWVAMRYLRPLPVATGSAPRPFLCHGTEPFWSLNSGAGTGTQSGAWAAPEERPQSLVVLSALDLSEPRFATPSGEMVWFVTLAGRAASGAAEIFSLTVTRGTCSDGMSDRVYGFEAFVARQTKGEGRAFQGCCTLDMR
ncbi:SH3 domain-containing protein [Rhodobacter sp. 24-YEA-8]|uniref:SH3 domain-containing protein n=1 Tax=Rhodobacter sp. 24-YEA-8 TaxID=1884310 RepID=UPI00089A4C0A|nr:SH3 domain-containing protein [Rhodobacter sp. 24-YEA-8]SEC47144.1 Uncharacterized membrane protein [Rhodobacter sp. 24-YEA-8]